MWALFATIASGVGGLGLMREYLADIQLFSHLKKLSMYKSVKLD